MKKFIDIPMDEIHQKILDSINNSDEFENDIDKVFTSIILDLFIHKCDGLQFFIDYYSPTESDMELFFKEPLIEYMEKKMKVKDLNEYVDDIHFESLSPKIKLRDVLSNIYDVIVRFEKNSKVYKDDREKIDILKNVISDMVKDSEQKAIIRGEG